MYWLPCLLVCSGYCLWDLWGPEVWSPTLSAGIRCQTVSYKFLEFGSLQQPIWVTQLIPRVASRSPVWLGCWYLDLWAPDIHAITSIATYLPAHQARSLVVYVHTHSGVGVQSDKIQLETGFNEIMRQTAVISAGFRQKSILISSLFILGCPLYALFPCLFLLNSLDPTLSHLWETSHNDSCTSPQPP